MKLRIVVIQGLHSDSTFHIPLKKIVRNSLLTIPPTVTAFNIVIKI
jgi:hypothetical protein